MSKYNHSHIRTYSGCAILQWPYFNLLRNVPCAFSVWPMYLFGSFNLVCDMLHAQNQMQEPIYMCKIDIFYISIVCSFYKNIYTIKPLSSGWYKTFCSKFKYQLCKLYCVKLVAVISRTVAYLLFHYQRFNCTPIQKETITSC